MIGSSNDNTNILHATHKSWDNIPLWHMGGSSGIHSPGFFCALFVCKNMQMFPNNWVFRNFIWVLPVWAEFLKNLIYWTLKNVSENLSFGKNLPEFRVKIAEFCRKAEFYRDLSFGPNAQKKSLVSGTWDLQIIIPSTIWPRPLRLYWKPPQKIKYLS